MTDPQRLTGRTPSDWGIWLLSLAALLALAVTVFEEFDTGNGIHGSEGLLLVVVSSALMLAASLIITVWSRGGWVHGLLSVLIFLDILGTALAGYLLESYLLVALMAIAFVGWLGHTFARPRPLPRPQRRPA